MKLYTVKKQSGQWAVCSDETVVLRFETSVSYTHLTLPTIYSV